MCNNNCGGIFMARSGIKFEGFGWLAGLPKFYERQGKYSDNFLVATIAISSQKRQPDNDGRWRVSDAFQTYYIDVRGKAAEWLKKEMEDPARAWKSGDYIAIHGTIVPIRPNTEESADGKQGMTRYVMRVYSRMDLNNFSAYERIRTQNKQQTL